MKSVSINVRLMERKDICYFHKRKMFNKKNDIIFSRPTLVICLSMIYAQNKIKISYVCFYK